VASFKSPGTGRHHREPDGAVSISLVTANTVGLFPDTLPSSNPADTRNHIYWMKCLYSVSPLSLHFRCWASPWCRPFLSGAQIDSRNGLLWASSASPRCSDARIESLSEGSLPEAEGHRVGAVDFTLVSL